MKRAAFIFAALVASVFVASAAGHRPSAARTYAVKPPDFPITEPCLTRAERRKAFWFRAADRTRLAGVILGQGRKGVVLAHMGSGNLCNWFPYARTLARKGFRVMAFDFRTYGISDIPELQTNARRYDLDVIAAVKLLRKRGARSVVLAGGSLGAGAVVVVAAQMQPPVQGVISLSAPLQVWDFDISEAARQLQVPVLFVAAEDDGEFPNDARSLYGESSAPGKQLLVVPQGGHGTNLVRGVPAVRNAVNAFFAAHS